MLYSERETEWGEVVNLVTTWFVSSAEDMDSHSIEEEEEDEQEEEEKMEEDEKPPSPLRSNLQVFALSKA